MSDFLAINTNGDVWPGAQYEIGGPGGRYEADLNGIIHGVLPNHAGSLIVCGAIPLLPIGWDRSTHRLVIENGRAPSKPLASRPQTTSRRCLSNAT